MQAFFQAILVSIYHTTPELYFQLSRPYPIKGNDYSIRSFSNTHVTNCPSSVPFDVQEDVKITKRPHMESLVSISEEICADDNYTQTK